MATAESVTPGNATERWLPVVGYEGLYMVSDLGNVRSLHKAVGGVCVAIS